MVSNQVSVDLEVSNTSEGSSVVTEQIKLNLDFNEQEKSLTLTVLEAPRSEGAMFRTTLNKVEDYRVFLDVCTRYLMYGAGIDDVTEWFNKKGK